MESYGGEATDWSNPEFVPDGAGGTESVELSTVDPSHIIHLIRQLLPNTKDGKTIHAEQLSARSGVLTSTTAEASLIGENCTPRYGLVEENGNEQKGQEARSSWTLQEISGDALNNTSTCGSPVAGLPQSSVTSTEDSNGAILVHSNGGCDLKNGNVSDQSSIQLHENTDFTLNGAQEGSNGNDHEADSKRVITSEGQSPIQRVSQDPLCSDRSPKTEVEILHGNTLVAETDCGQRQEGEGMKYKLSVDDDTREEAGCVLWDLAATESHAEFMVEHHILDVLQAYLYIPRADRVREICLGILGNLACHPGPARAMIALDSLVENVVQHLFVEGVPCLTETCRLLSAALHSEGTARWVEGIKTDVVVERIIWIAGNTLDSQLMEKCTELILVMVDSRGDGVSILLPSLLRLGLPGLLTDLVECELGAISEGSSSRGDAVLDIVLQIAESLSISDESASQLAANDELFSLLCEVIRLSASDEIGPSGITATVLIANLLTEDSELIRKLLHDGTFLGPLLALVPCAGQDPGARNALWSILGRICRWLVSTGLDDPRYGNSAMLAVLADGCSVLLDDLEVHVQEDVQEEKEALSGHDSAANTSRGLEAKAGTVIQMIRIMDQWIQSHGETSGQDTPLFRSVRNAKSLLHQYAKATKFTSFALKADSYGVAPTRSLATNAPVDTS